jgi:hypothetical protein
VRAKVSPIVIATVMLFIDLNCGLAKDWGSITIKPVDGNHEVVLENSKIRAVYKKSPNNWAGRHPTCMVEFYYKKIERELIENGRWDDILDPIDHSKNLQGHCIIIVRHYYPQRSCTTGPTKRRCASYGKIPKRKSPYFPIRR